MMSDACAVYLQATSARLIGEAIQQNPAFITLRKIEACSSMPGILGCPGPWKEFTIATSIKGTMRLRDTCVQAAREIASTISNSSNRVLLNSDSLLLNLVSVCCNSGSHCDNIP